MSLPRESKSGLQAYLELARNGDEAAKDRLFAACRSYVALLAQTSVEKRLQAKMDASDLVQQTFLDAHRDFQTFSGQTGQEWLAWLRKILAHNAGDAFRHFGAARRQSRREVSLHQDQSNSHDSVPAGIDPPAVIDTPSQIVMQHEQELLLAEAVSRLADDYRQIIVLRNIQRLPFDEVARIMNRSRPAAQMLWMRALQKLKEILKTGDSALAEFVQP